MTQRRVVRNVPYHSGLNPEAEGMDGFTDVDDMEVLDGVSEGTDDDMLQEVSKWREPAGGRRRNGQSLVRDESQKTYVAIDYCCGDASRREFSSKAEAREWLKQMRLEKLRGQHRNNELKEARGHSRKMTQGDR